MYFLFDLKWLIITKTQNRWNGLEEWLIDVDIGLCIDGIVCKIQKLYNSWFLVGLVKEAVTSELLLYELTGG
jgi:hypothetical protein